MSGLTHLSDLLTFYLHFFFFALIFQSHPKKSFFFFFAVVDLVWARYIKSYYVV